MDDLEDQPPQTNSLPDGTSKTTPNLSNGAKGAFGLGTNHVMTNGAKRSYEAPDLAEQPKRKKRRIPVRGSVREPRVHSIHSQLFSPFFPKPPKSESPEIKLMRMKVRLLAEELKRRNARQAQEASIAAARARIKAEDAKRQRPTPVVLPSPPTKPHQQPAAPHPVAPHPASPYTPSNARFGRRSTPRQRIRYHLQPQPGTRIPPELLPYARLLIEIMDHKWAFPFNTPVDWKRMNIPNYPKIIKSPMDLGTIKKRIEMNYYRANGIQQFSDDVHQVWKNAFAFNRAEHDVHRMAKSLKELFDNKMYNIKYNKSAKLTRSKRALPSASPAPLFNGTPALTVELSYREKQQLRSDIFKIPPDKLGPVVEIISADMPKGQKSDEIEIDIEALTTPTLRRLKDYVDLILHAQTRPHSSTNTSNGPRHLNSSRPIAYTAAPISRSTTNHRPAAAAHSSEDDSSSDDMSSDESDSSDDFMHRHHRPSSHPSSSASTVSNAQATQSNRIPPQPTQQTPAPTILTPSVTPKPNMSEDVKWNFGPTNGTTKQAPKQVPPPPPPPPNHTKTATNPSQTTLWQKYQKPATALVANSSSSSHSTSSSQQTHQRVNTQKRPVQPQMQRSGQAHQQASRPMMNGQSVSHQQPAKAIAMLSSASNSARPAQTSSRVPPQRQPGMQIQSSQSSTKVSQTQSQHRQSQQLTQHQPSPQLQLNSASHQSNHRQILQEKRVSAATINLNKQNDTMEKLEAQFGAGY